MFKAELRAAEVERWLITYEKPLIHFDTFLVTQWDTNVNLILHCVLHVYYESPQNGLIFVHWTFTFLIMKVQVKEISVFFS